MFYSVAAGSCTGAVGGNQQAFEQMDETDPPPEGAVFFVGSSTISTNASP